MASSDLGAWGAQGHRLVASLAAARLTATARANVTWLLPDRLLAGVATWADDYIPDHLQTAPWHYVNIPRDAVAYDRDRDCPRQPGAAAGSRADRWRDCVVDRILYSQQRLADASLDRADRAAALKFLVHFVADLHQPFHAVAEARGGNGIPVVFFGSATCQSSSGATNPCQLHGVWDTQIVAHRQLSDSQYLQELSRRIGMGRLDARSAGTPAEWAAESHKLGYAALVPLNGAIDQAYYQRHIGAIDERLALGGVRLAAAINASLKTPPPPP